MSDNEIDNRMNTTYEIPCFNLTSFPFGMDDFNQIDPHITETIKYLLHKQEISPLAGWFEKVYDEGHVGTLEDELHEYANNVTYINPAIKAAIAEMFLENNISWWFRRVHDGEEPKNESYSFENFLTEDDYREIIDWLKVHGGKNQTDNSFDYQAYMEEVKQGEKAREELGNKRNIGIRGE